MRIYPQGDMQMCRGCHTLLPFPASFNKEKQNKSGYGTLCRECTSKRWAEKPGRPRQGRKPYMEPEEKVCTGCNRSLPIDKFYIRTERKNGRRSKCNECCSRIHDDWRLRNVGASRRRNLKSKYKITEEQYFEMLDAQGGGCGICGSKDSRWKTSPFLHVDHDHTTGEVRGLLCHWCNIAVGAIENTGIDPAKMTEWLTR